MRQCPECDGSGVIFCPVCHGSGKDPRNPERPCTYGSCDDGYMKCNICDGTGWLDDNDDYRAWNNGKKEKAPAFSFFALFFFLPPLQ